ncbi:MAG TPA: NAD kinase [Cytophagaceae bacterium]|jgi:NAD+ kinase
MKIAIHGRPFPDDNLPFIRGMFDYLAIKKVSMQLYAPFANFLEKKGIYVKSKLYTTGAELLKPDFILSVGGDGTLLETVTFVKKKEIPILGINAGRLGFLATTPREKITESLDALFTGDFRYDDRSLIRLESEEDIFNGLNFGLNEFTILKKDTSSMIVVHTYIDGEYLNSYWADGLIVSTPTGSTGYSLSCGGPLVLPQSNNFIIAPVSPHNLNVRPIIVSDNSVISFKIEGRGKNVLVSLDSRSKTVPASITLKVKKESFKARLVEVQGYNFLETLRNKLNWGLDLRN